MTVKDRIMEFCRMSGIKPGRFERECGLSNAYLSKLKHRLYGEPHSPHTSSSVTSRTPVLSLFSSPRSKSDL